MTSGVTCDRCGRIDSITDEHEGLPPGWCKTPYHLYCSLNCAFTPIIEDFEADEVIEIDWDSDLTMHA